LDQALPHDRQQQRGLPPAEAPDLYEAEYYSERREDFALFRQHIRPLLIALPV
jgi:hypothetical protein